MNHFYQQLSLLDFEVTIDRPSHVIRENTTSILPLNDYDKIIIQKSGGKDSVACTLKLLKDGVDKSKLELWHQDVDGGDDDPEFFDWPVTKSYIQAFGDHLGIPVYFQWRAGGILGEMMRQDSITGDVYYLDDGRKVCLSTKGQKKNTRLKWPAKSADLRTRFCSPYAKIDVAKRVINNHPMYQGTKENPMKILVITGKRREESSNRARYAEMEKHSSHSLTRFVDTWRPVIDWNEHKIWELYEEFRIMPHPAYLLGYSRVSCFGCIFSSPKHWATMREIAPERFNEFVQKEKELNFTLDAGKSIIQLADSAKSLVLPNDPRVEGWIKLALGKTFRKEDIITQKFELPSGAFKGSAGGSI